ncbi:non-homologous end-joining DNA ligase [Spongiactinospora rosea]|nr:non-homologous end-joining DNA ligase [Spongiactinospora rosea]
MPYPVEPMLAVPGALPTDGSRYALEIKWDGIRAIVYKDYQDPQVRITGRHAADYTSRYPEVAGLAVDLAGHRVVLDGELVAFDRTGRPAFQRLQRRMHVTDPGRLAEFVPVTYLPFDLLHLDGYDLFDVPYLDRRDLLERLGIDIPPRFPGDATELLTISREQGLEGVIAKRLDSPYRPGRRSDWWIKVKNLDTRDVVIGGWRPGRGRRAGGVGSLLMGAFGGRGLVYVGHVGTGFTDAALNDLHARLAPLETEESPFAVPVPPEIARGSRWVRPELVGEVAFTVWTEERRLRNAVWRGLRPDKVPAEVIV